MVQYVSVLENLNLDLNIKQEFLFLKEISYQA